MAGLKMVSESALESYLTKWRDAYPQRALAWPFLSQAERIRYGTLAALEQEWLDALRAIREPQVAAAKLAWWREEMDLALRGEARHPLTRSLFADARVRNVRARLWTDALDTALLHLEPSFAPDFATQLVQERPLHDALARIETAVWFGTDAESTRAQRIALLESLIESLRGLPGELERGRSPLPMNLLARHGLTRESLAVESPARRSALHDYVAELGPALEEAATLAGPLSLFRAVQMRHDLRALRLAEQAGDQMRALVTPYGGLRGLFATWRQARVWRGIETRRDKRGAG